MIKDLYLKLIIKKDIFKLEEIGIYNILIFYSFIKLKNLIYLIFFINILFYYFKDYNLLYRIRRL